MSERMSYRSRIYDLLGDKHGVVTIKMAAEAGVPAVELRKIASRGGLERVGRGAYRIPFAPMDGFSSASEALAMVGPGSYVVGEYVLAMNNLGVFNPRVVEVASPFRVRRNLPEQVRLVPSVADVQIVRYAGIPCESVYSVLKGFVGSVSQSRLRATADQALKMELLSANEYTEIIAKLMS